MTARVGEFARRAREKELPPNPALVDWLHNTTFGKC